MVISIFEGNLILYQKKRQREDEGRIGKKEGMEKGRKRTN
jgi:hypothetical protein